MPAFLLPKSIRRAIAVLLILVGPQATQAGIIQTNFGNVTDFPLREDYDWETGEPIMIPDEDFATTLVQFTPTSGFLAQQVVSLRFTFNGVENGGTAFREFQVTAVPEPTTYRHGPRRSGLWRVLDVEAAEAGLTPPSQ